MDPAAGNPGQGAPSQVELERVVGVRHVEQS